MIYENQALVHEAIGELRHAYEPMPGLPVDTDIVWVLSAPGTYLEQATPEQAGVYSKQMHDKLNLLKGFEAVRDITAERLGKTPEDVSFQDIEEHGPTLYYNGEGPDTAGSNYRQNEDLRQAASQPDFPFPVSKLVIGEIDVANTPAQARGFAEYLHAVQSNGKASKVGVVSLTPHAPRVARYIQQVTEEGDMPNDVEFYGVPVLPEVDAQGAALREIRKIHQYYTKGDLAKKPAYSEYYQPRGTEEGDHTDVALAVGHIATPRP